MCEVSSSELACKEHCHCSIPQCNSPRLHHWSDSLQKHPHEVRANVSQRMQAILTPLILDAEVELRLDLLMSFKSAQKTWSLCTDLLCLPLAQSYQKMPSSLLKRFYYVQEIWMKISPKFLSSGFKLTLITSLSQRILLPQLLARRILSPHSTMSGVGIRWESPTYPNQPH